MYFIEAKQSITSNKELTIMDSPPIVYLTQKPWKQVRIYTN